MRKINIFIILTVLSLLSCSRYLKKDIVPIVGQINGKIIYHNKAISNANVYIYTKTGKDFLLSLHTVSSPTDQNGKYSLELEPGAYYLMVKKTDGPDVNLLKKNDYFGYFGGNPVRVSAESPMEVTLNCVMKKFDSSEIGPLPKMDRPGISGAVYYDDKPLDRAEVFVYLSMENDLRGPAYFSVVTDEEGGFYIPAESGTYYLVCRKRIVSGNFGPIKPGDFFGYYEANPLSMKQGEHQNIEIYVLKKEEDKESSNIITTSGMTGVNKTIISGKVHDLEKNPVEGVFICLYKDDEMVGKPEYISNKTDKDGSFKVDLVLGGKFYLIAKENFGGVPQPGDFIGYLSDSNDHSIEISNDEKLTGLELIGDKILTR